MKNSGDLSAIKQYKKELRKEIITKRKNMPSQDVQFYSSTIIEKIIEQHILDKCSIVMLYMDFGNEVMTKDLALFCRTNNIKLAYPRVENEPCVISARLVQDFDNDFQNGSYGIFEPKSQLQEIDPMDIDAIIIPGVVFDENKNRLGYGGGYYDTFLAKVRLDCKKVAIAFDMQIIKEIPLECHDVPMDMIITESCIY